MFQCEWDDKVTRRSVELFNDGFGATYAAQTLNMEFRIRLTRSAVMGKWNRLGLRRNPYDPTVRRLQARKDGKKDRRKETKPRKKERIKKVKDGLGNLLIDRFDDAMSTDPVATTGRPLNRIPDNGCRFTVASNDTTHLMCGAPGHPWCRKHMAVVYKVRCQ